MVIDTPKFRPALVQRFQRAVGPVTGVLLTHLDHVAHGRQWAAVRDARWWIHGGDLASRPDADRVIRGSDPVKIGRDRWRGVHLRVGAAGSRRRRAASGCGALSRRAAR